MSVKIIFRMLAQPIDMKRKFEPVLTGTYEVRPVRMSDTAKQTTPDQDSQSDPIQWKYYMRRNKRNLGWKWFLQVRKII